MESVDSRSLRILTAEVEGKPLADTSHKIVEMSILRIKFKFYLIVTTILAAGIQPKLPGDGRQATALENEGSQRGLASGTATVLFRVLGKAHVIGETAGQAIMVYETTSGRVLASTWSDPMPPT